MIEGNHFRHSDHLREYPPIETLQLPKHPTSRWKRTPIWMFWKQPFRRKHWRWIVDHRGCHGFYYWQYGGRT